METENQKITFVLTSCGRFDLLEKTLTSFFSHADAKLIDRFIITEDSGDEQIYETLKKFPQTKFEVLFNNPPRGQFPSIDAAYKMVETPYIFHCEDDWEFTKPNFIKPSLTLLEDFPELVQVLIRDPAEERHGSTTAPLIEHKGIEYRRPDPNKHAVWYGYSFNPGLRRLADSNKLGPFRYHLNEVKISLEAKRLGYCQAMLKNGGVKHIGKHRHIPEVFVMRASLKTRLKNSILKRTVGLPPEPDMNKILPISCFIVAHNEEDRIERALISVKGLVDEIVVVDSGSTDNTVAISKSYGAKTIYHQWEGDGPQKRFAEGQCRNHWLLNLDADEWLEVGLAQSIRRIFEKGEPKKSVWNLLRGDIYFGDRKLRWHMNLEKLPRLYDKRKTRFTQQALHTSVPQAKGERRGTLNGVLLHAHVRKISDMIEKEMSYARLGMKAKPLPILVFRLFTDFPQCFFKHYFFRNHIFGGKKGFVYSMIRAYERFLRTAMELEKKLGWVEKEKTRFIPFPLPQHEIDKISPVPISGYIIAANEAARIGRALSSFQKIGVREIIVITSDTDKDTADVSKSYGAKIIYQKWLGYGKQKRFAEEQCSQRWLLNLDADEWLDEKAIKSIRALFKDGEPSPLHPVYKIYRNDMYIGKLSKFPYMKGHYFMRLYDFCKIRFNEETVIENVNYNLKDALPLKSGRMLHIAVKSIWHVAAKENHYSNLEQARIKKSLSTLSWRLWLEMPVFFVKFYILRGTIFGGLQGFCYAMIYGFARFQRVVKLMENKKIWVQ